MKTNAKVIVGASVIVAGIGMSIFACTTVNKDLATPNGQLFCTFAVGAGQIVAPLIDSAASAAGGAAGGAVAVLATNAGAAMVQQECAQAAQNIGASAGVPVAPPPTTGTALAPVAINAPPGAPTAAAPAGKS